jgi:hypothetical protein
MGSKSQQVQIRVTPEEKAQLRRLAATAGQDLSSYVLSRALPLPARAQFGELLDQLSHEGEHRYILAELNDLLSGLGPAELRNATVEADTERLSPFLANYVAAMVEHTCMRRGVRPPSWTTRVTPLGTPYFAAPLRSLRLHLLRASPVAFKRRNLFVDSTVGDRV